MGNIISISFRARHLVEFSRLSGDRDFIFWFILTFFISLCSELLMIGITCKFSMSASRNRLPAICLNDMFMWPTVRRGDWLEKEMTNINDKNNSAAVYAGSSPDAA